MSIPSVEKSYMPFFQQSIGSARRQQQPQCERAEDRRAPLAKFFADAITDPIDAAAIASAAALLLLPAAVLRSGLCAFIGVRGEFAAEANDRHRWSLNSAARNFRGFDLGRRG